MYESIMKNTDSCVDIIRINACGKANARTLSTSAGFQLAKSQLKKIGFCMT